MNIEIMRSFRGAKHFQNSNLPNSCIDFSFNGLHFLSCGEANELQLYDCIEGENTRLIPMYKCGIELARFTLDNNQIVHSARKDFILRLIDLTENNYVRYFCGHTQRIISMSVLPYERSFISTGMDGKLYNWDMRSPSAVGGINIAGRSVAAYDPDGLIIAVIHCSSKVLKLYDVRICGSHSKPFVEFRYDNDLKTNWTSMQFAPNGKSLLISTDGPICYRMDAFNGKLLNKYIGRSNIQKLPIEACYSADSKYILSGSDDGRVSIWDAKDGIKVATFKGDNINTVHHIRFNPKHLMFASASISTLFWLPRKSDDFLFQSFNDIHL